jgi:hypothetical protein
VECETGPGGITNGDRLNEEGRNGQEAGWK